MVDSEEHDDDDDDGHRKWRPQTMTKTATAITATTDYGHKSKQTQALMATAITATKMSATDHDNGGRHCCGHQCRTAWWWWWWLWCWCHLVQRIIHLVHFSSSRSTQRIVTRMFIFRSFSLHHPSQTIVLLLIVVFVVVIVLPVVTWPVIPHPVDDAAHPAGAVQQNYQVQADEYQPKRVGRQRPDVIGVTWRRDVIGDVIGRRRLRGGSEEARCISVLVVGAPDHVGDDVTAGCGYLPKCAQWADDAEKSIEHVQSTQITYDLILNKINILY